jgi:tRNA-dihydrouridine synthase B
MRDPDHAMSLVEATVRATTRPVTLKMRLGWDYGTVNAPTIARRAQEAGVQMITVHGRTRCQFYTGKADWAAIRAVREATNIPLVANGDGASVADALSMLEASGADAVMFGRSCYGRPWWAGVVAEALQPGLGREAPNLEQEAELLLWQQEQTLSLYGHSLGNKVFRKHLGWTLERHGERGLIDGSALREQRVTQLRQPDNAAVTEGLRQHFRKLAERRLPPDEAVAV